MATTIDGTCVVTVHDGSTRRLLAARADLVRLSPTAGFAWGFRSKETAQLAFALVYDALGGDAAQGINTARALNIVHVFKHELIRHHWKAGWMLSQAWIVARITLIEETLRERAAVPPEISDQIDYAPF